MDEVELEVDGSDVDGADSVCFCGEGRDEEVATGVGALAPAAEVSVSDDFIRVEAAACACACLSLLALALMALVVKCASIFRRCSSDLLRGLLICYSDLSIIS